MRLPLCLLIAGVVACDSPTDEPTPPVLNPPVAPPAWNGSVLVKTVTSGESLDIDGYVVLVQNGRTYAGNEMSVGVNDSLLIQPVQIGHASSVYLQLRNVDENCWVTLPNVRHVSVRANDITRVEYVLDCIAPQSQVAYDRLSAHHPGTLAFHGSLSERYVWRDDGRFRLRYQSSRFGAFEYFGTSTRAGDGQLDLAWDGDGRWAARATIRGDTLAVSYNDVMWLSDFEPGEFIRSRR